MVFQVQGMSQTALTFDEADINHDGVIDREEYGNAIPQRIQRYGSSIRSEDSSVSEEVTHLRSDVAALNARLHRVFFD